MNILSSPSGKAGKNYTEELARLINDWTCKSATRDIAFKAVMVMASLLLQKLSKTFKGRHNL